MGTHGTLFRNNRAVDLGLQSVLIIPGPTDQIPFTHVQSAVSSILGLQNGQLSKEQYKGLLSSLSYVTDGSGVLGTNFKSRKAYQVDTNLYRAKELIRDIQSKIGESINGDNDIFCITHEEEAIIINRGHIMGDAPIKINNRSYLSLPGFQKKFPAIDVKPFFNQGSELVTHRVFSSSLEYLGEIDLLPFDSIEQSGNGVFIIKRHSRSEVFLTYEGIDTLYGDEYDIVVIIKFLQTRDIFNPRTDGYEVLYKKDAIDAVLRKDSILMRIGGIEEIGIDKENKPIYKIGGSEYFHKNLSAYSRNPYEVEYLKGEINKQLDPHILRISQLESECSSLRKEISTLRNIQKTVRETYTELGKKRTKVDRETRDSALKDLDSQIIPAQIELGNKERELSLLNAIDSFDEGNIYILGGEVYIKKEFIAELLKGYVNPIERHSGDPGNANISIIENVLYVVNPSILFPEIDIEWDEIRGAIKQFHIAGGQTLYNYKDIMRVLLENGYAYKGSYNQGNVIKDETRWVNPMQQNIVQSIANQLHRGVGAVKRALNQISNDGSLDKISQFHIFSLDENKIITLYELTSLTQLIARILSLSNPR